MQNLLITTAFFFLYLPTFAQSPVEIATQACGTTQVEVVYTRPSVEGRIIFGELVPYGKVWRTGGQTTATIEFRADVKFGGKPVKAGKYALYTIPGKSQWQVILNSGIKSGEATVYNEKEDVVRVEAAAVVQNPKNDTFTIRFANAADASCDLHLLWDDVVVSVTISN